MEKEKEKDTKRRRKETDDWHGKKTMDNNVKTQSTCH